MANIKIVSYRDCMIRHKENYPKEIFSMRVHDKNERYLSPLTKYKHFGNPFTKYKFKDKTVEELSLMFIEWLNGKTYYNLQTNRRDWINKKINSGELDDTTFLYYRDCTKITSHTLELIKFINRRKKC